MKKVEKNTVGYRIRFARELARLGQQKMADNLRISKRTLINWEQNKSIPRDPMVDEIAQMTSCSASDILLGPLLGAGNKTKQQERDLIGAENSVISLQKEVIRLQRQLLQASLSPAPIQEMFQQILAGLGQPLEGQDAESKTKRKKVGPDHSDHPWKDWKKEEARLAINS